MIKYIFAALLSVFAVAAAGATLMKALTLFGIIQASSDFEDLYTVRPATADRAMADSEQQREIILNQARVSLQGDPLDPDPFSALISTDYGVSDAEYLVSIVQHLNRVDPRNRMSKVAEVQLALSEEDIGLAVDLLAQLIQIDRANQDTFMGIIVYLAAFDEGKRAIENSLAARPEWAPVLIRRLIAGADDMAFIGRVAQDYPETHAELVRALFKRGDHDIAYIMFLDLLSAERVAELTIPYNRTFKDIEGAPPFNWDINARYAGLDSDGLYLSFFGRAQSIIVEQAFSLPPGRFTFSAGMSGRLYLNGSRLGWQISCVGQDGLLMEMSINELFTTVTPFEVDFEVPQTECSYQYIRLIGVPGEFPRTARAQVKSALISQEESVEPL